MNNMDKKVLIYCRVSTQQQTTDRQKEELLKFVEDNHWNVEEEDIFIDVISGFKKGEFRPEYAKMLERVEYGDIDIILFSEFSRLARNATELLEQIKLFIDKGINLYFDKQKLWVRDSNKDVGSLILLHVLAVMSSYEIELFVERSLSGKITKVQAGHGGGDERAYGYMHNENKQIVINPIESKIVARIFEMYVGGYSSIQISEILNAEKVPAPYIRKLNEYKKNREAKGLEVKEYKFDTDNLKWRISTINRLMHNELYKGNRRITFYKPDPTNPLPLSERQDREIVYEYSEHVESLRIVSDELFQQAQDKLSKAHYNKNNAVRHENLLKHLMVCGECGANFSVGKSNETSKNYISGGRTYKCYGRVNRKDKPRTCTNGAELRQWKLDGLVLQLSIQMFAEINIQQSNILKIENLGKEIEELVQIKSSKNTELVEAENLYKKTLKRLIAIEDDEVAKNLISDAKHKYDETKNVLNKTMDKLSREITTKRITIDNLRRLNANPLLINKMDEIRKNRDLVKTMVDEYIDKITIFRLHELWLLVVVSYKGGEEMWGTIKCARYKKEEMFYDELHCHYGVEFQGWLLNNTEHCFSYDNSTRIITYHGGSKIYVEFKSGEYDYDTFNQMIQETGWMGCFPFYAYEDSDKDLSVPFNEKFRKSLQENRVDWKARNDKVLERLLSES